MTSREFPTLRDRIVHWIAQGYVVQSETAETAQLVRPRRFNPVEFVAMPAYLLEYLGQRDRTVYLSVEPDGTVREQGNALDRSRYRRAQELGAAARLSIVVVGVVVVVGIIVIAQAILG